nr:MAG TPA: hypothetical protein [Caudoviricetes sp.]
MKNFAVFILSHGRPNNVITLNTLKKCGYTGEWYIIIDNEDSTADEYYKNFGEERVIMFDKLQIAQTFDTADTFNDRKTIVYARNACFDIANKLGIKYFLELDDDYTVFMHRYIEGQQLRSKITTRLDDIFKMMIDFLNSTGALTVAFVQGGDLIGGLDNNNFHKKILRKAMNSFFCDVDKPFKFLGRVNEDVNTYTLLGQQGKLIMSISEFMLNQKQTQSNAGGMTSTYLDNGTYVKSFYSVMYSPSCVKVAAMGDKHMRMHHQVKWECCTPKILSQKYKKGG